MGVWKEGGNGKKWRVGVYLGPGTKKSYRTAKSEEHADALVRQLEEQIAAREPKAALLPPENSNRNRTPTVHQYYQEYFNARMDTLAVKSSTRKSYVSVFKNHILPEFGEMQIGAVTDTQVETFIGKLGRSGLAYNTIKGILDNFSGLFTYAVRKKVVLSNPLKDKSEFYTHAKPQIEILPL